MIDRRAFLRNVGIGLLAAAGRPAFAAGRPPASARAASLFARLTDVARARAARPPEALKTVPEELLKLSYDQFRQIRFKPEKSLWRGEKRFFEVQLFHPGFTYKRAVEIFVDDVKVPFDPSRFVYPAGLDPARLQSLGYAGLRLIAPFKQSDKLDEFLALAGASYFRAIGRTEWYGASARCLAIDTGGQEEFPEITALHLLRPEPGDGEVHVVAEVRSARSESVFHLAATPGDPTTIDVDSAIFLRAPVDVLGIAPLSSMFLFGEEQPGRFDDWRPEVHDSDGLVLWSSSGEQIFRPLRNPKRTTVSTFQVEDPKLFGLVQRDRQLTSYQDLEAHYESRPSAWIEPRGSWGKGAVLLLEIATRLESDDNIASMFVPAGSERELHLGYRLSFGKVPVSTVAGAQVRAVRSGIPFAAGLKPVTDGSRLFVVDWAGGATEGFAELATRVDATGGTVSDLRTEKNAADGSWRTAFRVHPSKEDVELRAFLHGGGRAVSETLAYLWQPGKEVVAR